MLRIRVLLAALAVGLAGCHTLGRSQGGGQTDFQPPRAYQPRDVALPDGYRIEVLARDLTFPTGVAFDAEGRPHVVESGYSYGEDWTTPRLLRVETDGRVTVLAAGERNGPWTGVAFHDGSFYVAEGGVLEGGRILRIAADGSIARLVSDIPSRGDHHTNGPVIAPDGTLYFSVGTATNSGVVGVDNFQFGWLTRFPDFHDLPCERITLAGRNFSSDNPLTPAAGDEVETGAFVPFGTRTSPGQVVEGRVPCSGAVLRVRPGGGAPELVAWGFRNPFGLALAPDGTLFVTENQADVRGSRPVFGAGDLLWRVEPGRWYGWPDFHGSRRLGQGHEPPGRGGAPEPLLDPPPGTPPRPAAVLGVHASANGFDFSRSERFGYAGEAFIALFGDEVPATGKVLAPVGFKVVRVDPATGAVHDFAVNRGRRNGPASKVGGGGLERPIAARFDPAGEALYVVDFGVLLHPGKGAVPKRGTGALWRITRTGGSS